MLKLEVQGLKELQDQLLELGAAVRARKALVRAARRALEPVLLNAQMRVPVDSGLLRDSLKLVVQRPKGGNAVLVAGIKVAVGKGGGKKDRREALKGLGGPFSKREGRAAKRKVNRQSAHWRWHFVEVGTSSQPARPFLRPVFDAAAPWMIEAVKLELAKEIQKVLRKRKRKSKRSR